MNISSCNSGCQPAPCADALALTAIGTPGKQGPPGEVASFFIGTVTTSTVAGASLTLVQASPPIYQLNLTLPVGQTQTYTTPQTFNAQVTFNGAVTSTGTNTWNGTQQFNGNATFAGAIFYPGITEAADTDCISGRVVVVNGQLKYTQGIYNTVYIESSAKPVTKAYDSVSDTAFGPTVNFATACATSGRVTVFLRLRNPGAGAGTPTALSYYTIKAYDGATQIGEYYVSNYEGGGVTALDVNLAAGNHAINLKVAGDNVGDTGAELQIGASTIRVDV